MDASPLQLMGNQLVDTGFGACKCNAKLWVYPSWREWWAIQHGVSESIRGLLSTLKEKKSFFMSLYTILRYGIAQVAVDSVIVLGFFFKQACLQKEEKAHTHKRPTSSRR